MVNLLLIVILSLTCGSCATAHETVRPIKASANIDSQESLIKRKIKQAQILFKLGETSTALAVLREFTNDHPELATNKEIQELVTKITSHRPTEALFPPTASTGPTTDTQKSPAVDGPISTSSSTNIGVVLPLTGENSRYGQRVLNAIELGLALPTLSEFPVEQPFIQTGEFFNLVVFDSKSEAAQVAKAVDLLIANYEITALLGDISADGSEMIARKSREHHIPALLYTRSTRQPEGNNYTFHVGLSAERQTEELVSQAMKKGAKKFAILYPQHAYGREMNESFRRSVEKNRGSISASESYDRNQTTFTNEIKKMVHTYTPFTRTDYRKCVAEAGAIADAREKKNATQKCAKELAPIINFDALFIPDIPKNVSYIIPALAAEDVFVSQNANLLENFRNSTKNPTATPVQLLGGSSWNSPLLATRSGRAIDGALFIDSVDLSQADIQTHPLISHFQTKFSATPSTMEAQAFNAASVLRELLGSRGPHLNKQSLLQSLTSGRNFSGIGGPFSFDKKGDYQAPAYWFTFNNGKIERL